MIKIQQILPQYGNYIAGFVDGEGSFNVSFKIREDYLHKVKITACFNISQKEKKILAWIKHILKCGTIRARGDGVFYYEVTNVNSLAKTIIPFFEKFPLRSQNKLQAFIIFKKIVKLIENGEHLTREGVIKVYNLRDQVKVARKRKYSLEFVLKNFDS